MKPVPVIQPYHKNVYAYSATKALEICGYVTAKISTEDATMPANFLIVPGNTTTILGHETSMKLNLLCVRQPSKADVNQMSDSPNNALDILLNKYSDRFNGLGKLKDVELEVHVIITPITPLAQKESRLNILMLKEMDQELEKHLELGVIERVTHQHGLIH